MEECAPQASGDEELKGITPRAVDYIFDRINSTSEAYEYTVGCSFVEIYMERIRDLLDRTHKANNLDIRTDLQRGVFVDGATELVVNDDKEVMRCLAMGTKSRQTGATGRAEDCLLILTRPCPYTLTASFSLA